MKTKNNVTQFEQEVYDLCSKVPKGKVTSYKEIAHALNTKAYRAVGTALRNNPNAPNVPCHRVVASDGGLGGFMGTKNPSGLALRKKAKLLSEEGVQVENGKIKDFDSKMHKLI